MIRSDEHGRILLGTEESPITTYATNAAGWVEAMLRAENVAAWETAAESRHLLIRVGTEVHEHLVLDEQGDPVPAWDGAYDRTETRTYDDGDHTVYIKEYLAPAEHVHIAGPIYPVITPRADPVATTMGGTVRLHDFFAQVVDGEVVEYLEKRADQTWLVTEGATVQAGDVLAEGIAAVTDPRPHYNLRIGPWAQETLADDGVTPRWQETVLMWMDLGAPIGEAEKNKAEDGIKLNQITLIDPTTINSPAMRW